MTIGPAMPSSSSALLARLPSMRLMLAFDVSARHLNLVRAAEELGITQGALSRQIRALEDHLGVRLFERHARGLRFTQEGELLYDFTQRGFETLGAGIGRLTLQAERQTLVLSVARSFALRVLIPRLAGFTDTHPHIHLSLDIHRYFADIASSGVDVSIRLGGGDWQDCHALRLTRDRIVPVCAPSIRDQLRNPAARTRVPLLRNIERDDPSLQADGLGGILSGGLRIDFNDSASMLAAAEASLGVAISRSSLVADAESAGRLVRLTSWEACDGQDYYAVCTERAYRKPAVKAFLDWVASQAPS
ncbi:MAG: LysR substrate-binding domain-containing protein [Pigmentiphaga sp.]|uniref:LysR substrate-binding domain-containing protein n=1 Tax=Pigmentiphaga sp. TaxID=1977564 RepID=UPI0029B9E2E3|nr:LysR substrate-binding domain-containing protein [Pigmentiphaga sp.]MDX3906952.1 LysR substrate-binding domain-containing protein [Pigmentiphaga sp.]